MKQIIFSVFVLITIIPSFWVALSSNIVHAAFSLLFTFFGIAGLYVLLGADYIGVVQVIIYIGGILVLIIFGVMMTQRGGAMLLSVQLPGRIFLAAVKSQWPLGPPGRELGPTSAAIGDLLLGKYLIPFEAASLLLLIALVGALLIVRKSVKGEK
jgi:NADH:ubiquinone oxidoreductase subunit 6 (subunit J)